MKKISSVLIAAVLSLTACKNGSNTDKKNEDSVKTDTTLKGFNDSLKSDLNQAADKLKSRTEELGDAAKEKAEEGATAIKKGAQKIGNAAKAGTEAVKEELKK